MAWKLALRAAGSSRIHLDCAVRNVWWTTLPFAGSSPFEIPLGRPNLSRGSMGGYPTGAAPKPQKTLRRRLRLLVYTRRRVDRTGPKTFYYPSNQRAGINLNRVFISIVAVIVLALIEGRIDIPKI
jgi:hypothetical protein